MRPVLEVTGTTVITPRPRRVAAALAASLLTTTAGRILFASDRRAGSRLTWTISPRRTSVAKAVACGGFPRLGVTGCAPGRPRLLVRVLELAGPQQSHSPVHDRGPGLNPLSPGVRVEELHVLGRQAHTNFHTSNATWSTTKVVRFQRRSMMVAVDMAPPAHMVIRAVAASRRSSSCRAVVISRAPVLPTGWPRAIAPPLTLSRSGSGRCTLSQDSGTE